MAPRGQAKARDLDFSNVGKAGRRTGITLKEGKRDEHGMEEVDGIFSSPEKSPVKENGFDRSDSYDGSDGMSMDEGNGLGPADFFKGANGSRTPHLPPPVARSPIKSGMPGSPRRTPGLRSSQSPQRDLVSSSPSDGRSAKADSRRDVSPLTSRSINATPSLDHSNAARNKGNKRSQKAAQISLSDSDGDADENGDSLDQAQDDFGDSFNADDDTMLGNNSDDMDDNDAEEIPAQSTAAEKRKGPGRGRKPAGGAKGAKATSSQETTEPQGPAQKRKRAGRPPKAQNKSTENAEGQRPAKKAKTSEPKRRITGPSGDPELDKVVENYVNRTGPLRGRSLYILKREAPSDPTTTHTRSGRASVRPLAYWKNERCVYGDEEAAEGERFPLSKIKEIIRTEELEPERKQKRRSKKSKSRKSKDDESEDEDEQYRDPYEEQGGVLHGYIRKWDPESQTATNEEEVLDIAYAPSGIETRDVKGATFRFAKLLSSPFIGSGIVELPPGGVKKPKNSKKMHMVFYVVYGRVLVDISGVQFSAGKGCVFQVPRVLPIPTARTPGCSSHRAVFLQKATRPPGLLPKPTPSTANRIPRQLARRLPPAKADQRGSRRPLPEP
ncbi:Putative Cupin domain protein (AFU_orthologue; AFUA_1G07590) [Aspergillus calidoustus]|uniref:Putative Cupin domain protein (AFU_orthologue AFUA_1G07590) n=1 Tax=Aspergillus calidoustus TaxID=454130 RepID=A0A0U5HJ03_ASPCI|nr:Putative Cupin domain protein (AFU_orthologue; AFUA_1G07590) [Aspergillus calidoustus]